MDFLSPTPFHMTSENGRGLFFKNLFILGCVGFCCCASFSRVVVSRGSSLVAVCGLLMAVTSLVAEHRLRAHRLQQL